MPKETFSLQLRQKNQSTFSKDSFFSFSTSSLHPSIDSCIALKAFEKSCCCHRTLNQNSSSHRAYCFSPYRHTSTHFPAPALNKHMCSCSALISPPSVFPYIYLHSATFPRTADARESLISRFLLKWVSVSNAHMAQRRCLGQTQ